MILFVAYENLVPSRVQVWSPGRTINLWQFLSKVGFQCYLMILYQTLGYSLRVIVCYVEILIYICDYFVYFFIIYPIGFALCPLLLLI